MSIGAPMKGGRGVHGVTEQLGRWVLLKNRLAAFGLQPGNNYFENPPKSSPPFAGCSSKTSDPLPPHPTLHPTPHPRSPHGAAGGAEGRGAQQQLPQRPKGPLEVPPREPQQQRRLRSDAKASDGASWRRRLFVGPGPQNTRVEVLRGKMGSGTLMSVGGRLKGRKTSW